MLSEVTWLDVNARGIDIWFGLRSPYILHEEAGRTAIWGIPVERVGFYKMESLGRIYAVYAADYSVISPGWGDELPGSSLRIKSCESNGGLSDATCYSVAFQPRLGAVSRLSTSYWVSDKDDCPKWRHSLLLMEECLDMPILL